MDGSAEPSAGSEEVMPYKEGEVQIIRVDPFDFKLSALLFPHMLKRIVEF